MKKMLLAALLSGFSCLAHAVHYDVMLGTSQGAVAGSQITVDFYGDFDLAGKLPIDSASGHKLFPGYFDDLEGGPRATDDPGFQAFAGTFKYGEEVHFRALGQLNYWSPESQSWGVAGNNANITLYGGIPVDAWLNYMLNPGNATYAAQYQYYANGTVFGGNGVSGPVTALIDGAGSNGSFHSHLDWKVSDAAAAGVYMLTLQVWSPTLENGVQKYLDSDPFHVVFKTAGISQAQFDQAFDQRIAVAVPEPESYALLLLGLAVVGLSARRRKALI